MTDRIEKSKSVSGDGTASFPGFSHTEHVSVLASMLCLNAEIPEDEAHKIVKSACFAAAGAGKVTPVSLCAHAEALERKYLCSPKTQFRVVTSISADFMAGPVVLRAGSVQLGFGRRPGRTAERLHLERVKEAEHSVWGTLPDDYSPVLALVSARNPDEAVNRALDQIDLIRAIWNLWKNRGRTRKSGGKRTPVNSIVLAQVCHFSALFRPNRPQTRMDIGLLWKSEM